jgi:hypothetical protein
VWLLLLVWYYQHGEQRWDVSASLLLSVSGSVVVVIVVSNGMIVNDNYVSRSLLQSVVGVVVNVVRL